MIDRNPSSDEARDLPGPDPIRRAMSLRSSAILAGLALALAVVAQFVTGSIVKEVDRRQVSAFGAALRTDGPSGAQLANLADTLSEAFIWPGRTQVVFEQDGAIIARFGRVDGLLATTSMLDVGGSGIVARISHDGWPRLLIAILGMLAISLAFQAAITAAVRPQFQSLEHRRLAEIEARRALAASEERYRGMASLTADMFWETDADGRLTYFQTSGKGRLAPIAKIADSIIGEPVGMLLDAFSHGARVEIEEHFDARDPIVGHQIDGETDEGPLHFVTNAQPRFSEAGKFIGYQGATRDVTDLVVAQSKADTVVRQIESLFSNAPAAFLIKDLNRQFVHANNTFAAWTASTPKALVGEYHAKMPDPADSAWFSAMDARVLRSEGPIEAERTIKWPDGKTRRLSIVKYPIRNSDGEISLIGMIATDISRMHDAEERLQRAQRLEAIGQLTGGIAHDFNNLLTVARGNLELLDFRFNDADASVRKHIDAAMRAVDHGAVLTQQLLSYARKQTLSPAPINVGETIDHFVGLARRVLRENITLKTRVPDGIPDIVADGAQLETALLNLALNAQDAMPEGGDLTIDVTPAWNDPSHVVIAVSDTGTGIEEGVRDKVLEPFFTTKEVGSGSGLGLSMVYGFVKQSGGDLELKSVVGRGTTVRLTMPVARLNAEADDDAEEDDVHHGKGRALLVEDNPDLREIAQMMLSSLGYIVDAAPDAESALRFLAEGARYDVLLTDLVLPGALSGRKLAEQVHESYPDMRIVITSGYADSVIKAEGELPEEFGFLPKPYKLASISKAVGIGRAS